VRCWSREVDSNHRPRPYEGLALDHLSYRAMCWSPRSESNGHARGPRLLRPVRLPIPPRGDDSWCPMQDSNLHALRPRLLKPLRLPVPPIGQVGWGAWSGSNRRPPGSQPGALPPRHTHHRKELVSAERFELPTPCSQSTCATNCATRRNETGSRGWRRSSDLSLIKRVLCRLSYATTRNWLRSVGSNHGPSP
jgi:hypothetical protein